MDAIALALLRQRLEAAAGRMGDVLQRTAVSANIKERRDFSCCLFDARGRLLAQAAHVPVHLGSMSEAVAAMLAAHPDPAAPVLANDPYAGGTHLPDLTLLTVARREGRVVGYAASRAHHADVGGRWPGSMGPSDHIDDEGVRLPPTPYDAGVAELLKSARNPAEREADLRAQRLANDAGVAALLELADDVAAGSDALLDQAERATLAALARLPTGTFTGTAQLDPANPHRKARIDRHDRFAPTSAAPTIRVDMVVAPDALSFDFSASDPQTPDCYNAPAAVTRAAVCYCVACLLDDPLVNAGTFRPVAVVTRPGTLVAATHPAAVAAGNTEVSQRVVDAVFDALPNMPAQSCGTMSSLALGGEDWTYYETVGGGCGATATQDGESAVQCHMTNTLNTPAEALEMQYPLRVRRHAVRASSGGAGTRKGGDGIVREIEFLAAGTGTLLTDRRVLPPRGDPDGTVGRNALNARDLGGRASFDFEAGDVLTVETPGGGGHG